MTMLTPDEALYALLCKYLLKEADSNEQQWVNTWLQASPEHPVLLAGLDKLLNTATEQVVKGAMDTETAWKVLSERMEEMNGRQGQEGYRQGMEGDRQEQEGDIQRQEGVRQSQVAERQTQEYHTREKQRESRELAPETIQNDPTKATARIHPWWFAAAASILLLISTGLWYFTHQNERQINYNGAQLVKLDDGSSIQLDPAAQLQVLPGFGKKDRKVILKGKATFDVTTDAAHPFIIDLGDQAITVLGTRFSVDNSNQLRVFINSGKIKLTRQQDSVILTAGMLLQEDTSQQHYQVGAHITDVETRTVVFKDTPLSEVLKTINVLYHINVTADAQLQQIMITGNFTGETAENIVNAIAFMTNANVVNNGTVFELRTQD